MPLSDEQRSLLLKFIAGETDKKESERVEDWLASDPEFLSELEQLWELWNAVGTATNVNRFNIDHGWESLLNKGLGRMPGKQKTARKTWMWVGSVAAAVLAFLAWTLWPVSQPGRQSADYNSSPQVATVETKPRLNDATQDKALYIKTKAGSQKEVKLPDGTKVWLNGNSEIRYALSPDGNKRLLYLSGQAFFDVKHQAGQPFVVKTKHATIAVLGTRFDVVAYPNETFTEAVLTGGSILFTTESDHEQISRQITPGQKISLNYLSGKVEVTDVDTAFYASWKEGKLMFRNETFRTVAMAMDHKYNVNIVFKNRSLEAKRLNGYLEKETLEEALQALQLTLQFNYKIAGDTVVISR